MPEGKWNIANLNVQGQAMFGDGNRMRVVVPEHNSVRIEALLMQLREAVEALPEHGQGALPLAERNNVHTSIRDLMQEVKKKPAEQDRGFLGRSIDRIAGIVKCIPQAVNTVLSVKSLLGL